MKSIDLLQKYIFNKNILIVGGSPSANNKPQEWYDKFEIIVRMNNYKKANNARTDIYFSYFGRNIKKTPLELMRDGVKFLINKCPNSDMTNSLSQYNVNMADYRWIYDFRQNWWFRPLVSLSEDQLINQIKLLDGYMPTVGFSAILFFLDKVETVTIIGFDCFESKIHNLDERWDGSGNHNPEKEKEELLALKEQGRLIWKN